MAPSGLFFFIRKVHKSGPLIWKQMDQMQEIDFIDPASRPKFYKFFNTRRVNGEFFVKTPAAPSPTQNIHYTFSLVPAKTFPVAVSNTETC